MDAATLAIGSLLPKLLELLKEEYKLHKEVKDEISSAIDGLETMHAAFRKRAEVSPDRPGMLVNVWAREVRERSYRIEDSVDGILNFQTKAKVCDNISLMIGELNALQEVLQRLRRYEFDVAGPASYADDPRVVDLYTPEEDLVGVDEARDELIRMLTEGDDMSKQQRKIVSIVGFAELGKTTLAIMVYRKLREQFECTSFVSVSPRPNMKRILNDMLRQLKYTDFPDQAKDEEQPINEIREFLRNKRYLIVIDDLWNAEDWDSISRSLPSNNYGSRVITTTRVNDIAKKCCSSHDASHDELIYKMQHLGYQNSKILFLKRFRLRPEFSAPTEVLDEILKVCGGTPGAIISIASLLPREVAMEESWQDMMSSLHPARGAIHGLEDLRKILSLSYFHLPNTLRTCLLYLATSAKDQSIKRDSLVRKWIAEGFISEDGGHSREEVANRYFDELINRNVIQPVQHGNCPGEEIYEVHYMMLHALWVMAKKQCFVTFLSEFGISGPSWGLAYLLSIQCSDSGRSFGGALDLSHVRSVTTLGPAKSVSFKHLEYMRVLDLNGCEDLDNTDVDDICRMILLKYLSLKQTRVTELPPEIGKLQNLETLDVRQTRVDVLPPEIGELQNLKTLDVRQTRVTELPPEIGKLQNLETLDIRQTRVEELPKEVVQLPKLTHLHFGQSSSIIGGVKLSSGSKHLKSVKLLGTVDSRKCSASVMAEISGLTEVREFSVVLYDGPADKQENDNLLSSIGKWGNLESLTIYGECNPSDKLHEYRNFQKLRKLKVAGRFVKVPGWIAQLSALHFLYIRVCKLEPNDLTILGKLPCLRILVLILVGLPRKQVAITSDAGFVGLEVFNFDCHMPWVTFEQRAMPSLKHLELKLYAGPAGNIPSGIVCLRSLNKVILRYSLQYESSDRVTETVAVVRKEAVSHANSIVLSINGDEEIFPSNTIVNRRITGTEMEE